MRIKEKIQERIPSHLQGLAKLLDRKIEDLQTGKTPEVVLDKIDLAILKKLGSVPNFVAHLTEIRQSLGQPEDLSGD